MVHMLLPIIINAPNKIRTSIMGVSHHFLLCISINKSSLMNQPSYFRDLFKVFFVFFSHVQNWRRYCLRDEGEFFVFQKVLL